MSEWISPAELGKELKVPTRTVYGFVHDDGLPAIRIGRHLRISRTDLDIWLEARRIGEAYLRRHGITPTTSTRRPQRRPLPGSGQRWKLPRDSGGNAA
jgi:excisionase family DNA binding protein